MPKLRIFFTGWLIFGLALPGADTASARDERWFQVELLIFARETAGPAPSGATTAEQWEPTPVLAYPHAARFLVEPQRVAANREQYPAIGEVDEFGRQILTNLDRQLYDNPASEDAPPPLPGPLQTTDESATAAPDPQELPQAEELELFPTPFVTLPIEQQQLAQQAARMERSGRYSVLYHETWRQPVADAQHSLPIILDRSGDTLQWPRLQGSIKLYLSRYLHLATNLWLNTAGDYLPGNWRMPAPPLGPPSLIIEALPPPEPEYPELELSPLVTAGAELPADELPAAALPEEAEIGYPYRHAVLLQQRRRMRSNELHYIDHPLFGVVVTLTPLTRDELTALALAESEPAVAPAQAL